MQNDPEKSLGNYNEIRTNDATPIALPKGVIDIQTAEQQAEGHLGIVKKGLGLVNNKIDKILGANNRLTGVDFALPRIMVIETYPEHPTCAGYFSPSENKIALIMDKIGDNPLSAAKVFIHEYLHFLSHNGRDDYEQVDKQYPVTRHNNVGFRRNIGLDIRKGKEGKRTSDYFLSFNEAVSDLLAIDILPDGYETYEEYRGLLGQVIEDAVDRKLGSKNERGEFVEWSKEQFKDYIYMCFFKGNLAGFTNLLKTVYAEFDISEQQFGLMTNKDDLPSVIVKKLKAKHPSDPPPSAGEVRALVQERIDSKTPEDYVTNIIVGGGNDPENKYGKEYDDFVEKISSSKKETINGKEYDIDNLEFIIYRGELAEFILGKIKAELDDLLLELSSGKIDKEYIIKHMDELLFEKYSMSMLSDGFREFYIYKHTKFDS